MFQALPRQADDPLLRRIGWLTATGFALCCCWLLFARFGPVWMTVPIILGMMLSLGAAFVIAARWGGPTSLAHRLLVVSPLGVYVGWLSAATFVSAESLPTIQGKFQLPAFQHGRTLSSGRAP